jgi:hypothetical protein
MNILMALADYDGTHKEPLEAILRTWEPTAELLAELVELSSAEDASVAAGATWLLRAWVEQGVPLRPHDVSELARRLTGITALWARLHVCQTIRSLRIDTQDAGLFGTFLGECRGSERPFIRAWATDGLHHLALRHPDYESDARVALEAALTDPAASVRARARRILDGK